MKFIPFFFIFRLAIASRLQLQQQNQNGSLVKPIKIEIHRETSSNNDDETLEKLKKFQLLKEIEAVKPDHEQRQLAIEVCLY